MAVTRNFQGRLARRVTRYFFCEVREEFSQRQLEEFMIPEVERRVEYSFGPSDKYSETDHVVEKAIKDMVERSLASATSVMHPWRYPDFPRFIKERAAILECVGQLEGSFDDLKDRQIDTVRLKKLLLDLRSRAPSSPNNFLRVLNMCLDALENTRSELLEKEQVQKLAFVLKQMRESIDTDQVNELESILQKSGLKPTPNLEGLAEFYTS